MTAATADQISFLANITLNTAELEHTTTSLARYYSNFLTSLEILYSGFLPSFFVNAEMLKMALRDIDLELKT